MSRTMFVARMPGKYDESATACRDGRERVESVTISGIGVAQLGDIGRRAADNRGEQLLVRRARESVARARGRRDAHARSRAQFLHDLAFTPEGPEAERRGQIEAPPARHQGRGHPIPTLAAAIAATLETKETN